MRQQFERRGTNKGPDRPSGLYQHPDIQASILEMLGFKKEEKKSGEQADPQRIPVEPRSVLSSPGHQRIFFKAHWTGGMAARQGKWKVFFLYVPAGPLSPPRPCWTTTWATAPSCCCTTWKQTLTSAS
jgi:hypothetical protein